MSWSITENLVRYAELARFSLCNFRAPQGTVVADGLPVVGDGLCSADMVVSDGRVEWIGAPGSRDGLPPGVDLGRAIVWPCPVDCHTHLDKGQIWGRCRNRDGSFASAMEMADADRTAHQNREEIAQRGWFQLRAAYAHGTRAIRSHVDGNQGTFDLPYDVLCELAEEWRGRIALQLCPLTGPDEPPEWTEYLADRAAARQPGVLSGFLYMTERLAPFLDETMAHAERLGLDLDFHADETLDPNSHCLRALAEAAIRNRFQGRILAGHCCALSVQAMPELDRTLDLVAEAGIGVVALPLCNSYLMSREAHRTPRHRAVAPVHEMRARGIPVAIASDNVRDPFYAYGDLNVPELFRDALRIMQLDHPVGDWAAAVTATPAALMGLPELGRIVAGGPADLVILRARNWSEFISRPHTDRVVLRAGRAIDTAPPDYAELDALTGAEI